MNPHTHRVLVIGNRGLSRSDLGERLRRIGAKHPAVIRIVVPGEPVSRLHGLADEVDAERREALVRMAGLVEYVRAAGVAASGRVDDRADPTTALRDGLEEFAPDEVVLARGPERGWKRAVELAERLRDRDRLPVSILAPHGARRSIPPAGVL